MIRRSSNVGSRRIAPWNWDEMQDLSSKKLNLMWFCFIGELELEKVFKSYIHKFCVKVKFISNFLILESLLCLVFIGQNKRTTKFPALKFNHICVLWLAINPTRLGGHILQTLQEAMHLNLGAREWFKAVATESEVQLWRIFGDEWVLKMIELSLTLPMIGRIHKLLHPYWFINITLSTPPICSCHNLIGSWHVVKVLEIKSLRLFKKIGKWRHTVPSGSMSPWLELKEISLSRPWLSQTSSSDIRNTSLVPKKSKNILINL